MSKKKKFNIIYNNDEKVGYGKGYYIIFEGHNGKIMWDSMYQTWEHNEKVDAVSVGILNRIMQLCDLGYQFDSYYTCDLKDLF